MTQLTTTAPALAPLAGDPLPFAEAVDRFLATRKSDRTRGTYRIALAQYLAHAQRLALDPGRADALIAFSEHMNAQRRDRGGTLANDTIRIKLKAVASLFTWLYTFGLSPIKPRLFGELVTMPEARRMTARDILTSIEASQLLIAAERGPDLWLIRFMLDCGLRISEALALRVDDVYAADDRFWTIVRGKGDKSREVETPYDLFSEISRSKRTGRLFKIHRATAWRIVKRLATEAGIEKEITPHALRHTHAHQLRLAGWPLEAIAQRLGHQSIETTKIYTHPAALAKSVRLPAMPWQAWKDLQHNRCFVAIG